MSDETSYEVYLTRKARGWDDATDAAAISLAEWQAYVASDPEMHAADFLNPTYRTSEATDWELTGASVWVTYSKNGRHGRYARFAHQGDNVLVADPDEEILGKMQTIAHALGARVQGADGYYFDDHGAPPPGPLRAGNTWAGMEYRDFQTYTSGAAAQPLLAALRRQGIVPHTAFDNGQPIFDASFANNQHTSKFTVQLRLADYDAGRQVLASLNENALSQANPNHYLFTASDEELFDLLLKPDEWSGFDVALASQLLHLRGHNTSPEALRLVQQRRLATLAQSPPEAEAEASPTHLLLAGYLLALAGGVGGLLIGHRLAYWRSQRPDDRHGLAYPAPIQAHGRRILALSIIGLALAVRLILLLRES